MATNTGTQVPSDAHAQGAFPPLQSETYASQLLWFALTFGALYLFLAKVALPRLKGSIEGRTGSIASDLAEAQRMKAETDQAIASYEKSLAEARAKAQTLAAETRAKASAEADAQRKSVEADLAQKMADAEKKIATAKAEAMTNVRGIAVDAASAIVEQIVGTAPAAKDVEAAVDAVLKG